MSRLGGRTSILRQTVLRSEMAPDTPVREPEMRDMPPRKNGYTYASVAQQVERGPEEPGITGSIPVGGTNIYTGVA